MRTLVTIVTILVCLCFIFWMNGTLTIPDNRPNYIIHFDRKYIYVNEYAEENGCLLTGQNKICGSYAIIKNK